MDQYTIEVCSPISVRNSISKHLNWIDSADIDSMQFNIVLHDNLLKLKGIGMYPRNVK